MESGNEPEVPEVVYHYTDQSGLVGILRKKKLWCTHVAYLNDASEYIYAAAHYKDMLTRLENDPNEQERMREHAHYANLWAQPPYVVGMPPSALGPWPFCAACFSEDDDDLSQWRAYGSIGSRFCIGFRTEALLKLATLPNMNFAHVLYGLDSAFREMRKEFVAGMLEIGGATRHSGGPIDSTTGPLISNSDHVFNNNKVVLQTAVRCKNKKFANEKEWRLYSSMAPPTSFRPGRSFIIPYLEVDLNVSIPTIASVIVGPGSHQDLSAWSVQQMLSSLVPEQGDIPVIPSKVPYRD